jgi:hypothetical protein
VIPFSFAVEIDFRKKFIGNGSQIGVKARTARAKEL